MKPSSSAPTIWSLWDLCTHCPFVGPSPCRIILFSSGRSVRSCHGDDDEGHLVQKIANIKWFDVWSMYGWPILRLSSPLLHIHTQTSSKSSPSSSHSDHIPCLHWCCCCRRSPRTRIKEQFNGMENIIGTTTLLPRESPAQLSIYTHQYVTKRPDKSGF